MKEVLKVNNVVGQIKLIKMTKSNNLTTTAKKYKGYYLAFQTSYIYDSDC